MVYELKDTKKVEKLFEGMEDTAIRSCLQGVMGKVYVTDTEHPRSAMAFLGGFALLAGEPDRELITKKHRGAVGLVPPDERWAKLIDECWPNAHKEIRFATAKDTKFDRERLKTIAESLSDGFELRRIDGELYDEYVNSEQFADNVEHFASKEMFLKTGRGFAVLKDGETVSAASSYTVYREGIEIQITTAEEYRRNGLASAAAAALILSCLDDGLYPSWDAANEASMRLAEKLGYTLSHKYTCCWVDELNESAAALGITRTK